MSSILAGISAIKATLDLAKITTDLVNRPNIDAEKVRANLHEMLMHAVSAQEALVEAKLEIADLHNQLESSKALGALRADMEFVQDGGYYIKKSEKEAGNIVQYCPVCWGNASKAVPLTRGEPGAFVCALHKVPFHTRAFHERQNEAIRQRNEPLARRSDFR